MRLGEIRVDRDRPPERRHGLIEFTLLPVNHPQRVMRLLQGGLQRNATFEGFGRRGEIVFVFERQPEVVMRLGVARIERDQLAISLDRRGVIGLLHQGEAEVVKRDLVIRFGLSLTAARRASTDLSKSSSARYALPSAA